MAEKTIAHYEIIEKRGEGGMGRVYLAHDPRLQRKVAIKVLSEDLTRDSSYRQRFLTEARSASALSHSNIVTIYEIGSDKGRDFIAMEYVDGRDLKTLINERGKLPLDELLEISRQLASGLAAAHRAGILHRDLKPDNVILTTDGNVKILDFGLAKRQESEVVPKVDEDPSAPAPTVAISQTQPGMIMGTPGFMSPESARGKMVDHRSDIFSLGCIIYELAAGKSPFVGDSFIDVLHNVMHHEPDSVDTIRSDLPVELIAVLRRCLEKEPQDRYSDANELETALRDVQLALQSSMLTPPPGLATKARRELLGVPLVAVSSIALVLAAMVVYLLVKPERGVATTTITVQNEEGQQIQREIPTREFRKRLAILPFEVTGDDSSQTWLAYAMSGLLTMDLIQDYYISLDLYAESRFAQEAGKVGYPGGHGAPLTLKRQAARASNSSHFVTGTIGVSPNSAWLDVHLYDTESSRLESEFRHEGASIFEVTDTASLELRRLLGVPEKHQHEWPDLPVTDISTNSLVALEAMYRGQETFMTNQDQAVLRRHLEEAVAADPSFAWALISLYLSYMTAGEGANPRIGEMIEAAMTHIYRLPERMQFAVKSAYFEYKSQPKKQLAVLRMWCDLYPDDTLAYESLVQILGVQGHKEERFAVQLQLLKLEPHNRRYLTETAEMYKEIGDLESARDHLETLVEIAPDDPKSHQALGELLQVSGRHQDACDRFEQALLLNPKDLQLQFKLSESEFQLGNREKARNILESIMEGALNPSELHEARVELAGYFAHLGQIDRAIEIMLETMEQSEGTIPPIKIMASHTILGFLHVLDGNREAAARVANDLRGKYAFPLDGIALMFVPWIYVELEDYATARQLTDELASTMEQMKWEFMRPVKEELLGRILEGESDLTGALEHYRHFLELSPTDENSHLYLGRCLRKMADYENARHELQLALTRRPGDTEVLFEAALVEHALGNHQQATEYLDQALQIWDEADPDCRPVAAARDTQLSWSRQE